MRRFIPIIALAALLGVPAQAMRPLSPTQRLLREVTSPADLRARLRALAASDTTSPGDAGEALTAVGRSFERSMLPDSAIATYRRALALRGGHEERLALIDALLARRAPGDVDAAIAESRAGRKAGNTTGDALRAYPPREFWGLVLADHADSALTLIAPYRRDLLESSTWRYRLARAELKAGDPREAYTLLKPLAIDSRKADRDVMALLGQVATATGAGRHVDEEIDRELAKHDSSEELRLWGMGARRIRFHGPDGFRLSGVAYLPAGSGRARAAIILNPAGESFADPDSAIAALRRAGLAVLQLDVRGSGQSVDEACPLPDLWRGREDVLSSYVVRDVRAALVALANLTSIDTSSYLVGAVGARAPIAAEAASRDSRIAALVLVSPTVDPLEMGPMRARLAARKIPAYYQFARGDLPDQEIVDLLLKAGNDKASRVVEATILTSGPNRFQLDPAVPERLTRWVRETVPGGPAARRSTPRKG